MGPEQWKDERPEDARSPGAKREDETKGGGAQSASDPREEEGYSQPESSAQKGPAKPDE